jgi:mannose-6-phosphate isomerase-like protein (cupin superfamily)
MVGAGPFSIHTVIAEPLADRMLGDADTSFVIAEWTDPGSPPGPPRYQAPLHFHRNEDEAWYVLEGRLRFRIGDDEIEAPAGSAVLAPRGNPHTFWNPTEEPARYLLIMAPKTWSLVEEIHKTEDRSPDRMRELFEKYDSELAL